MADKEMYDYLSSKTADYTSTELSVSPSRVLPEVGSKKQVPHNFDDGNQGVISLSSASWFTVTLQWTNLSTSDAGTIMDMYHDDDKADGIKNSFYWQHPKDGHTYTVKFAGPLSQVFKVDTPSYRDISSIKLRVLGVKPS